MAAQSKVGSASQRVRILSLSLFLACAGLVIGGTLVWGRSVEYFRDSESSPTVFFRNKPTMALQPRPITAPRRNFELVQAQQFDSAEGSGVVLLGIEELDESAGYASVNPPLGTWQQQR